jgi:hypothetical protein
MGSTLPSEMMTLSAFTVGIACGAAFVGVPDPHAVNSKLDVMRVMIIANVKNLIFFILNFSCVVKLTE